MSDPDRRLRRIEFWTSVGGAPTVIALLKEFRLRGYDALEISSMSAAEYRAARGRLERARLRARLYCALVWRALMEQGNRQGRTIRIVTTNPFFLPAWLLLTGRSETKNVFLLWDLYPDALVLTGIVRSRSWIAAVLAAVTRFSLRRSAATVFLSGEIRDHVERVYGAARMAATISVGADGRPFRSQPPRAIPVFEPIVVQYMGSMGHMHDIATMDTYWREQPEAPVRWRLHGSGRGYQLLRRGETDYIAAGQEIYFGEPLPEAGWVRALGECPVALITLAAGAELLAMPSKAYTALVAGQAILAICTPDSNLAALVRQYDCGWIVAPGDVTALRRCVREMHDDRAILLAKRQRAFSAGHSLFDCSVIAGQWEQLFAQIEPETFPSDVFAEI